MSRKECMCLSGPPQLCTPTFKSGQIYSSSSTQSVFFVVIYSTTNAFWTATPDNSNVSMAPLRACTQGQQENDLLPVPLFQWSAHLTLCTTPHQANRSSRSVSSREASYNHAAHVLPHNRQNKASAGIHRDKYSQPQIITGRAAEGSDWCGKDEAGVSHRIANY